MDDEHTPTSGVRVQENTLDCIQQPQAEVYLRNTPWDNAKVKAVELVETLGRRRAKGPLP